MDLKWVRKHDEDDDGRAADCRRDRRCVLSDDVAAYVIAERQVAGDGYEDVDECCSPIAGHNDRCGAEVRVVFDLVEDREHILMAGIGTDDNREGAESWYRTSPADNANGCTVKLKSVASAEVVDH